MTDSRIHNYSHVPELMNLDVRLIVYTLFNVVAYMLGIGFL